MRCTVFSSRSILVGGALFFSLGLASVHADAVREPLARAAIQSRSALSSVFLDLARAGKRLVAVGARGVVLLSDDDGANWRQASVPVSVTLTRVRFAGPKTGWAVGHFGTVLHTADGGETWQRQLDGTTAAKLALEAAQARAQAMPGSESGRKRLAEAEQLVKDGPDKPFLDLHFFDDRNGVIVGAFNLIFGTHDGGKTWLPLLDRLDNPMGLHLYAIAGMDDTVIIAGERGLVFRSDDRGATFARLSTPYAGTYFAASLTPPGNVLLAGLRGNVLRSRDLGSTWERLEGAPPVSISAMVALDAETTLLANHAGQLYATRGGRLEHVQAPALPPLAALVPLNDNSLLGAGIRGVTPVALSNKAGR